MWGVVVVSSSWGNCSEAFDCEVVTVLTDCGSSGLAIAGKSRGMRLTSAHASLLRNSLSVLLVTYTICRECLSTPLSVFPDSLSMVAHSISMLYGCQLRASSS